MPHYEARHHWHTTSRKEPQRTRVVRGGAWNNNPRNARSAYRNRNTPPNANTNNGFRVVWCLR
ncbi:MAG: hypothetical protein FJ272_17905 [Planctomycetes bacterium]|nr:hypothetical protein [Planctomycetota bacterium]